MMIKFDFFFILLSPTLGIVVNLLLELSWRTLIFTDTEFSGMINI